MIIQLEHQENDIWGQEKTEPEYDRLSNATIKDIETAIKFVSTKPSGSSTLKIMPGGYVNEEGYKYNDLNVYKKAPGKLTIVVPSADFEHGSERFVECHSEDETIKEIEKLIIQKW